uniref:Uncharacterized protein n=1 Tax=Romanomermis culicivorax TaxID=13658 RepID=A0A915J618_ROMCU
MTMAETPIGKLSSKPKTAVFRSAVTHIWAPQLSFIVARRNSEVHATINIVVRVCFDVHTAICKDQLTAQRGVDVAVEIQLGVIESCVKY